LILKFKLNDMANRLLKKIEFKGSITLLTGLHIGGTNSSMSIGGIDKGVIRNPLNNQPYIPGSSLKGKMRSLFEVFTGNIGPSVTKDVQFGPSKYGEAAELFGNAVSDDEAKRQYQESGKVVKQRSSRLIVRDCELLNADYLLSKTDIPYTEGKTEVVIDRIKSSANPRQIERVPAGAEFGLNMVLNIWEGESEDTLVRNLFQSLKLLKDDYLGGSGSRGYGQIAIKFSDIIEKTKENYYGVDGGKGTSVREKYQNQIESLAI